MKIICLTKDNNFVDEVRTLFDQIKVEAFTDYRKINKPSLASCDVLIVDLKDCLLPAGTFFSPILALSPVPVYREAAAVLRTGAKGYGNRHMRKENLWQAIESVKAGQIWLPPEIVAALIEKIEPEEKTDSKQAETLLNELSEREREVALMVAEGMTNQQIADIIFVSLRTVKAHLSSIYSKTGLRNRLELGLKLKG